MLFWHRKAEQAAAPLQPEIQAEIPRYPPFMKGLPVVAPERLLAAQADLVRRIAETAVVPPRDFARLYLPVIERFAAYVHLLPASQSHHHRGAGGLLRHSLEVALWALQSADRVLLDAPQTPLQRRETEPRWQLAVFLAALCHDAGKPATDLVVINRDRTEVWKPLTEDLYGWATRHGIDAYFIEWREGRARHHTALANLIADRIIGTRTLEWIEQAGLELVIWLMESLHCNPGPANLIHDLVIKADQTSVERDLKSLGAAMAGYDLGVPVERYLTDLMRRLMREGVWRVNEPGARLWNIGGSLYLVWPAAGEELARKVQEDGIPGIPRTPDGILDMLVERQIAFLREGRLWQISPACLAEKTPGIRLSAIRLRDEAMVSALPIPAVEGEIVEDTVSAAEHPAEDSQPAPEEIPEAAQPDQGNGAGHKGAPDAQVPAAGLDGAAGEAIRALLQDIRAGEKAVGVDADVDASGCLLIRWPDAFNGYGLAPKLILDELSSRGWLWVDPMFPLRKVLDAELGGARVKAIRLTPEISRVLVQEIGLPGRPVGEGGKPGGAPVADAPARLREGGAQGQAVVVGGTRTVRQHPTLDDVLAVLSALPVPAGKDGWRVLPKREVMSVCKRQGVMLTHAHLAVLAQADVSRFVQDGVFIRYRA